METNWLINWHGNQLADKLADKLADSLRAALRERKEVRIERSTKMAELRLKGLEESISAAEIQESVAREGGCNKSDVKVGDMRMSPNGTGIV